MRKIQEGNNLGDVIDLVFDVTEGKKFSTANAIAKELKGQNLDIVEINSGEYIVVEYKGESYIVFITDTKPFEVISVENDVDIS